MLNKKYEHDVVARIRATMIISLINNRCGDIDILFKELGILF